MDYHYYPIGDGYRGYFFPFPDDGMLYTKCLYPIPNPEDSRYIESHDSDSPYLGLIVSPIVPSSAVIDSVSILTRARMTVAPVSLSGAIYRSTDIPRVTESLTLTNKWSNLVFTYPLDPQTNEPWTPDRVNSIEQFGLYPHLMMGTGVVQINILEMIVSTPETACPACPFPWWWIVLAGIAGYGIGYEMKKHKEK